MNISIDPCVLNSFYILLLNVCSIFSLLNIILGFTNGMSYNSRNVNMNFNYEFKAKIVLMSRIIIFFLLSSKRYQLETMRKIYQSLSN